MARRVVVGWDGSSAADGALQWALGHSPHAQSLEIVEVGQSGRRQDEPHLDADEAAQRMQDAHPAVSVSVRRERGDVADVLAGSSAPDVLVAVGGRRHEEARHLRRTSTAYRLVLGASGPVAIVPQTYTRGRDVVVGVEGRSDAPCVLLAAAEEAHRRRRRLLAVHVPTSAFPIGLGALPGDPPRHGDEQGYQHMLDAMLAPVRTAYPSLAVVPHVAVGRAIDVLLAESRSAMLLVLGRNPGKPADRRSVTRSSMLLSAAPVLVVPPETQLD